MLLEVQVLVRKISDSVDELLTRFAYTGFNFNAILEKDNEWVKTYNTMNNGLQDPFYFLLPVFDTRLLCLSPKRQLVHKELARFLDMLDQVIIKKREVIANGTNRNVALEENEKDLLTLLIEAEAKGEGVMSNQELKVPISALLLHLYSCWSFYS